MARFCRTQLEFGGVQTSSLSSGLDYPHAAYLQHEMKPGVATGAASVYPLGCADGSHVLMQLLVLEAKLRLELVAVCED